MWHSTKFGLFIASMLLLADCTRILPESHVGTQKIANPYTMPASAYLALARNQSGSEKQALEIMAAGRSIYEGQWRYGLSLLQHSGALSRELADEKNILLAKVDVMRDNPHQAIAKLAAVHDIQHLPLFYQAQYHDMLAYAYQATGAALESVTERIRLDSLLVDPASQLNNRRALWLALTQLSQAELDALLTEHSQNVVLQGWIALAAISRQEYRDPDVLLDDLETWESTYPNHPARSILAQKRQELHLLPPVKHMALLLPLTGALAGPGHAVQDGFMAAFQANPQTKHRSVRVYNTDNTDVARVYERAVADGSDYIVGPLTKADVKIVAQLPHPVPTILLNDTQERLDPLAFQFGLSPTYEARQIAVKARQSGHTKALIIAPTGDWGNDMLRALSTQWTASNGQIVETWQYAPEDDLGAGIRRLLHASENSAKIRPTLSPAQEDNTIKRRQDFDAILLIAYPSKARQILPLLRYYFAADIPVYATSAVYSGTPNTAKDRDLNGIIFCDIPWIFRHPVLGAHYWPEQFNSYNRLYALGLDSYALAGALNRVRIWPAIGFNDPVRAIYLSAKHRLSRILVFGQFKQGIAAAIDANQAEPLSQ